MIFFEICSIQNPFLPFIFIFIIGFIFWYFLRVSNCILNYEIKCSKVVIKRGDSQFKMQKILQIEML